MNQSGHTKLMVIERIPSLFKLIPLKRNSLSKYSKNYDSDSDDDESTISGLPCISPVESQKSRSSAESLSLDGSTLSGRSFTGGSRRSRMAASIAALSLDSLDTGRQTRSQSRGPSTGMFSAKEQNTVLRALNADMDTSLEAMMKGTPLLSSDWIRSHKGKVAEMDSNRIMNGMTTGLHRVKDGKRLSGCVNKEFDDETICTNYTDVVDFASFSGTPQRLGSVSGVRFRNEDLNGISISSNSSSNNNDPIRKSYGSFHSRKNSGGSNRANSISSSAGSGRSTSRSSADRSSSKGRPS